VAPRNKVTYINDSDQNIFVALTYDCQKNIAKTRIFLLLSHVHISFLLQQHDYFLPSEIGYIDQIVM